ncbi:hypothetical protein YpsIP31758_A0002 (plasmid) [Yersinia pseudotuberculosis IP 31758]|uniref:Uncharacterized protein n=1 Tax=Yersinia pseudotuberculosis serotype O:1b (strain IP 31758) TaxID=349747 RepID=A0A0U1QT68_YERP3|nr:MULTISPECIES: hypothetical protein [Yersinia pseudotuberculosis complex]ABS45577.1 hypothetical protein YpsIP31758_A0002 [Yersinia pseudotuberculosis IP 31758]
MKYKSLPKELELIEYSISNVNLGERKENIENGFKQLLLACDGKGDSDFYGEAVKLKCLLIKQRNTLRISGCEEDSLHNLTAAIEFIKDLSWSYFRTTLQAESIADTISLYFGPCLFALVITTFSFGAYILITR